MRVLLLVLIAIAGGLDASGCGAKPDAPQTSAPVQIPAHAQTSPPPPSPTVDATKFDGLYRSMKGIEGATAVGVNLMKFSELVQAAATELLMVRDKSLNAAEEKVYNEFADALTSYKDSASIWQLKISAHDDLWKGEIPVWFPEAPTDAAVELMITKYDLPVSDRVVEITGKKYKSIPGAAPQLIWHKASASIGQGVKLMQETSRPQG